MIELFQIQTINEQSIVSVCVWTAPAVTGLGCVPLLRNELATTTRLRKYWLFARMFALWPRGVEDTQRCMVSPFELEFWVLTCAPHHTGGIWKCLLCTWEKREQTRNTYSFTLSTSPLLRLLLFVSLIQTITRRYDHSTFECCHWSEFMLGIYGVLLIVASLDGGFDERVAHRGRWGAAKTQEDVRYVVQLMIEPHSQLSLTLALGKSKPKRQQDEDDDFNLMSTEEATDDLFSSVTSKANSKIPAGMQKGSPMWNDLTEWPLFLHRHSSKCGLACYQPSDSRTRQCSHTHSLLRSHDVFAWSTNVS